MTALLAIASRTTVRRVEPREWARRQVLAGVGNQQREIDAGEARKLKLATDWADLHRADAVEEQTDPDGVLRPVSIYAFASEPVVMSGVPVDDHCLAELATALKMSHGATKSYVEDGLELRERLPRFFEEAQWFLERHPHTAALLTVPLNVGAGGSRILSLVNPDKLRRILRYMLDENEFLSPFGIRSLSRYHAEHPYVFSAGGQEYRVGYVPGDSDSGMFGGNSNWRGPIWMPVNFLLIESLQRFHFYFGNDFKVRFPYGSDQLLTLDEVATAITRRLCTIFLRNEKGERPVNGTNPKIQTDPAFKDYILFYEYFDGDNGRGVGASHQTGWTSLIAKLLQPRLSEQ